jgi:RNA polymerase sigma-70 factor (ECF subfamily)
MDVIRESIRRDCVEVYGFFLMLGKRDARDSHEAQDIASESFVRVWANAGDYRGNTTNGFYKESKPWLVYTFQSANRDIQRQNKKYSAPFSFSDKGMLDILEDKIASNPALTAESPQEIVIKRERLSRLNIALSQLAHSHREALHLVYYEGLSNSEASKALGIEEPVLKMRVCRAKKSLRRMFADYLD